MLKYLYALLLLCLASCATTTPTYQASTPELYFTTKAELPLYKRPSMRARAVRLHSLQRLSVVGRMEPSWCLVRYNDAVYYVECKYLELTQTAQYNYTPSYTPRSTTPRTIHTGPRGGRYYINKNGNKTYIKH